MPAFHANKQPFMPFEERLEYTVPTGPTVTPLEVSQKMLEDYKMRMHVLSDESLAIRNISYLALLDSFLLTLTDDEG